MSASNIAESSLFTISSPNGKSYWNAQGQLLQSAPDEMVLDHKYDPVSGLWVKRGEPVFPSRTNRYPYSNDFTTGVGLLSAGDGGTPVVTPSYGIGPDGVVGSATRVQFSRGGNGSSSDWSLMNLGGGVGIGFTGACARTLFVRSLSGPASFLMYDANAAVGAVYEVFTDRWSRLELIGALSGSAPNFIVGTRGGNPASQYFAGGDQNLDLLFFGRQAEEGSYPGPYIPTAGSAVTRAGDVLQVEDLTKWRTIDQGTLLAVGESLGTESPNIAVLALLGSNNPDSNIVPRLRLRATPLLGQAEYNLPNFGGNQAALTGSIDTYKGVHSLAMAFAQDDFGFSADGSPPLTDSSGFVAEVSSGTPKLFIGNAPQNIYPLGGWIRRVKFIPRRVANALLQEMTA